LDARPLLTLDDGDAVAIRVLFTRRWMGGRPIAIHFAHAPVLLRFAWPAAAPIPQRSCSR
jgi:hypothetical protein